MLRVNWAFKHSQRTSLHHRAGETKSLFIIPHHCLRSRGQCDSPGDSRHPVHSFTAIDREQVNGELLRHQVRLLSESIMLVSVALRACQSIPSWLVFMPVAVPLCLSTLSVWQAKFAVLRLIPCTYYLFKLFSEWGTDMLVSLRVCYCFKLL